VVYLLKRNLQHLDPDKIHVVEYGPPNRLLAGHEAGNRNRALSGDRIRRVTSGFQNYADPTSMALIPHSPYDVAILNVLGAVLS
jgi:hypothetical protein